MIYLTDIEGTTSSISFVRDVLFPYAHSALPGFVASHGKEPEVRRWLDAVASEIETHDADAVVAKLRQWIDEDRKHTALKALQGLLWQTGYRQQDFKAHVYPDAALQMRAWQAAGDPIYVYSSGSIAAQKLFFEYSEAGNLLPLFSGHFDTETGPKRDPGSYREICQQISSAPDAVTFLSDVVEELDAAREAGLRTILVDRLQDYPTPRLAENTNGHRRVESFSELDGGNG
jgi:enolase-phosphatase E1